MRRRKLPPWAVAVGLVALTLALDDRTARGSMIPRGSKGSQLNPHTGQPIVRGWGSQRLTDDELRALIAQKGFADAKSAFAIAKRESGGYTGLVVDTSGMSDTELHLYWGPKFDGKKLSPEVSVGLWQINVLANPQWTADQLTDPSANADAAFALSNSGTSWGPWGGGVGA